MKETEFFAGLENVAPKSWEGFTKLGLDPMTVTMIDFLSRVYRVCVSVLPSKSIHNEGLIVWWFEILVFTGRSKELVISKKDYTNVRECYQVAVREGFMQAEEVIRRWDKDSK